MEGDEGPLFPPKELQDEFDLLEEYQKDVLCNEANYYDETENEDEIEDNFDNLYEDEMDDEENESEPVDDTSGMLEDEYSVDDGAESTEEDEGIGLDEEEAGLKAREEEELANSIIDSIQTALPSSIQPDSTYPKLFVKNPGSLRMTDLGFRISQMVLLKQREGDVKMATHEDRDEPKDILLERHIQGKRKNKTGVRGRPKGVDLGFGKSTTQKLPSEVAKLMGKANVAYVERKYEEAIPLLLEVIRQASGSFEPYHTLGLVYEESGQYEKAFSYYLLAAHLSKGDGELWGKLTVLAIKLGKRREVVYCLSKFMHIAKIMDPLPFWVRSRLYLELNSYRNVIFGFSPLLNSRLREIEHFQSVAKLALKINLSTTAAKLFKKIFEDAFSLTSTKLNSKDVSWSHLNLLLELYLAAKDFEGLIKAVETLAPLMCMQNRKTLDVAGLSLGHSTASLESCLNVLPIDIKVKLAIAYIHLRAKLPYDVEALLQELNNPDFADLRFVLGNSFLDEKEYLWALYSFLPLIQHPLFGSVELCLKIASCYRALERYVEALETLTAAAHINHENKDVRLAMSEIYRIVGRPELATEIIKDIVIEPPGPPVPPDLDPNRIFREVYGPTDIFLLFGEDQMMTAEQNQFIDTESSLLQLPNSKSTRKHPALRQIRRRARKTPHVRFSVTEIEHVQAEFKRAKVYYDFIISNIDKGLPINEPVSTFISISTPWIDDLIGNPHLRSDEKYRTAPPEILDDLASLHGLTTEEWFEWLWMHLIVAGKSMSGEMALKVLRLFLFQSAFAQNLLMKIKLRLLNIALALSCGREVSAIVGARWFLTNFQGHYFSQLLYLFLFPTGKLALPIICSPLNARPIIRNARKEETDITMQLLAGYIELSSGMLFEEACTSFSRVLSILQSTFSNINIDEGTHLNDDESNHWIPQARLKLFIAVVLLHSGFRRTCPQPKLALSKAFCLLGQNFQELLVRNERSDKYSVEIIFNFARACHMAGLLARAETLYRQVLALHRQPKASSVNLAIVRVAAYNLHLIYFQAGNLKLARSTLYGNCLI